MKKRLLKILIIMLIFCLAIPYVSFANTTDTKYYESSCTWETYNDNPDLFNKLTGLPMGTTPIAKNRPFNYRIWFGKGIVVYGTPGQANIENGVRVNYKEDTLNPSGIGFYKKAGKKRGEYRYDGYTIDGNIHTNANFPNDGYSALSLEERPWIYRYWDSNYVNSHFLGEPSMVVSNFNKAAIFNDTFIQKKTRDWIDNGMNAFKIRNGVTDKSIEDPAPEKNPDGTWDFFNFINVLSAPSAKFNGEGRMFRLTSSRGLWYQTFTVQKYQKEHTPVNVSVNILNESELKFEDFGSDNPADFETQRINVKVEVTATLKDENYINDNVAKAVYYTREDRDYWTVSLNGTAANKANIQIFDNKARTVFNVPMSKGEIKALSGGNKTFAATARCYYFDKESDEGNNQDTASFSINNITPPVNPPPVIIQPECHIPNIGFDIIKFPASDNTDMNGITERKVLINGVQVDDILFFSGNYVFGVGKDGLKKIDVYYTSTDGSESFYTGWAYIYNTKPNAQFRMSGTFKQNRKLTVTDISDIGNVKIVTDNYPITNYSWSFRSINGDEESLKMRNLSDLKKELMYKKPGSYEIELTVTNSLGRVSDPYVFDFEVFLDYQPAVEIDLNNSVVTRNEKISAWYYNAVSTDNDTISSNTIELWYDSNNDGTYDQLLNTYDGKNGFPEFTSTKLGKYKFVDRVVESFGEETLPEFITPGDTVSKTVEREILVDNLVPMTGLYVQIPIVRPQIDTYFMLDANLNSDKVTYAKNNRIEFDNYLRSFNILSDVELWDMHIYTYSQPASTSIQTGSSYPSSAIDYTSNGYSGTLDRTSVSNNKYQTDEGHYENRTESKTATGTSSGWTKNYYKYTNGSWVLTGSDGTNQPTISYSDSQGFKGTLSKTGFTTNSDNGTPSGTASEGATYTRTRTFTAYYSGTVTRTVQEWVPNLVWHNDYTGFYSGTIYKDVRQPYTDPFRAISKKFIIYITDGSITDINDLKAVMSKTDARLILIGQNSAKSQITYDYFILNDKPIDQVIQAALDYISSESPGVEEYTVLANTDTFTLNVSDYDEENDPITEKKLQYVQDQNYFDNPTGMESFAVGTYSDITGWVANLATKFTKTGKYTIYRRVKDQPSTDPAFSSFSKYSGTPQLVIYVHRKPIALATLDWDYDAANNIYDISWVDRSYDLDHQFNRPDKGIVDRKIMYRIKGGEWIYKIPDKLVPGTYELQYFVKDPEGAWSDPFITSFTLSQAPPMQFDARLRTLDNRFSLSSVPASEYLEAYNVWTRFPYNVRLEMSLYNGASRVSPLKTVNYSGSTGTKDDNDIYWNSIPYQIPDTLSDGPYTFRITAVGDYGQSASKDFSVTVNTPINLTGMINGAASNAQIQADSYNSFTFNTSKYVSRVQLSFKGQTYTSDSGTIALISNNGTTKTWEYKKYISESSVTDNETGIATFIAYTPSGKNQSVNVDYKVITIQAYDFTVTSILDVNWRGYYFDLNNPVNGDGEKYGYPRWSNTDIKTQKMPINSLSLVSFPETAVQAGCKVKGYIRVKGGPDSVSLIARYQQGGVTKQSYVSLSYTGGNKYNFEWIIPQETDQETYVCFDVEIHKGSSIYSNEKWVDTWPASNTTRKTFLIRGSVLDYILFNQSN